MRLALDAIKINGRHRRDLGDIDSLAQSIGLVGLLQPIVVTKDCRLVAGERRIAAARKLGWIDLPATVADNVGDAIGLLTAERDENTCRKDFSPSEAVTVCDSLAELLRIEAKQRQREGGKSGGKACGKLPQASKGKTRDRVAAAVGLSGRTYDKAKRVITAADEQPEIFGPIKEQMDRTGNVDAAARELNRKRNQQAVVSDTPAAAATLEELIAAGQKFATIYADPPWQYGNQATRASTDNHYPTMTPEAIAALPVAQLAADDAHLHLWTTNAFLFECKEIMEAWGFEYKSCLVWIKPQMGIGNYWRVSHEFLLLGVRGRCPFLARDAMSWVEAKRTGHSTKPEVIRKIVERVSPGPRLEMFGRRLSDGWTVWGNQISRTMFDKEVAHECV
jgi:ParB/RepB/Spo0J family partition protein